jgi:transcriptional regulator with XRE-family HTH domain
VEISLIYGIPTRELVGAEVMISLRQCFAEGLSKILNERRMTQIQFAKTIGVTQASVSRWLNAKELPSANTMDEIASYFKIHPMQLFANPGDTLPIGHGKIILDLERIAAESGYIIKKKDG